MLRASWVCGIIFAALCVGEAAAATLKADACPAGHPAEARCRLLNVPEDRSRPDGRRLDLKVVVLPARAAKPQAPVFILSGGPGQPATDSVPGFANSWMRERHDVVFVDLRGTGRADGLDCPPRPGAGLQTFLEPPFADTARFAACRAELSKRADLGLYTTPIAMADLDEARRALGYDEINLMGGSYGTRAALVYLRSYGRHVRTAYLSGAAPFANRAPLYHAAAAQRAFDRVADQCAADAACRARFPTFRENLAVVLARLKAEPATVAVTRPDTQTADTVRLTEAGFGDGLRVMLYSAEGGRRLPLLLEKARAGDYQPFAQAALNSGYGLQSALRLGLLLSVSCPEDIARIDPSEIPRETAGSFAGDHRVRGQMAACAVWPTADLPDDYAAPLISDVPTLIVSGDLDPVTPPQWGEALLRHFSHGRHLVVPGAHVAENACVDAAGQELFETGAVDTLDLSCADAAPLPPFVLEDRPTAP